jgi:hypothetical protein
VCDSTCVLCLTAAIQYAAKMYGLEDVDADEESDGEDIEASINKELADIRTPKTKPLFRSVKLDTQCCMPSYVLNPAYPMLNMNSGVFQDAGARRTCGVCGAHLSRYGRGRAATKLQVCEKTDADYEGGKSESEGFGGGSQGGTRAVVSCGGRGAEEGEFLAISCTVHMSEITNAP